MTIVAHDYYEYLPDYVQVLFQLTVQAIQNDQEEVSHYALEFWNTLCDTEEDIALEQEQGKTKKEEKRKKHKERKTFFFIIFANILITPLFFLIFLSYFSIFFYFSPIEPSYCDIQPN